MTTTSLAFGPLEYIPSHQPLPRCAICIMIIIPRSTHRQYSVAHCLAVIRTAVIFDHKFGNKINFILHYCPRFRYLIRQVDRSSTCDSKIIMFNCFGNPHFLRVQIRLRTHLWALSSECAFTGSFIALYLCNIEDIQVLWHDRCFADQA